MNAFPTSVTNNKINLCGLLAFLLGVVLLMQHPLASANLSIIFLMACWLLPILSLEIIFLNDNRKQFFSRAADKQYKVAAIQFIGLLFTLLPFALAYWVFPEYRAPFYEPWWALLKVSLPWVLLLAFPYFLWRGGEYAQDAYYQLGLICLGRKSCALRNLFIQHYLGWLVKAFFLPLMISYFWASIQNIEQMHLSEVYDSLVFCLNQLIHPTQINHQTHYLANNFSYLFNFLWTLIFLIDVGVISVGYATTLGLFDNQIRSTESTLLGWVVTLACYAPFNAMLSTSYLAYDRSDFSWGTWLMPYDLIYVAWGSAILLLCGIYVASSIAFGLRFSNLTHRGIITHGPYRYFKHPAYLAKNISWWLISIPFIANQGASLAVRDSAMLLTLNFIYYLRAKTEERHLSHDPVYLTYLEAMKQQGLIAKIKRVIFNNISFLKTEG